MNPSNFQPVFSLNEFAESWSRFVWESSWQSAVVAAIAVVIVLSLRRFPARIKYAILVVALVKFVVPPFFATPTGVFSALPERPVITEADFGNDFENDLVLENEAKLQFVRVAVDPAIESSTSVSKRGADRADNPAPEFANQTQSSGASGESREADPNSSAFPIQVEGTDVAATAIPVVSNQSRAKLTWASLLLLIHACGIIAWAIYLLASSRRLTALSRRSQKTTCSETLEILSQTARRLKMKVVPRLATSDELAAPLAFGCFHPTILLPSKVMLDRRATEVAIAHELAHHRRRDPWINSIQNVLLIVWWFNPLIWILNRELRRVREDCCDDIVLEHGIANREQYSDSLLAIARLSQVKKTSPITVSFGMLDAHPLANRLRRIMDPSTVRSAKFSWRVVSVLVAVAMIAWPGLRTDNESTGTVETAELIEPANGAKQDQEETSEAPRELDLNELKTITGMVEGNGNRAVGVEVRLYTHSFDSERNRSDNLIGTAISQSDGTFEMKIPLGKLVSKDFSNRTFVCCDADGRAIGGLVNLSTISSSTKPFSPSRPIQLIEPISQTIEFVDQNDQPIVGAKVRVTRIGTLSFEQLKKQQFRPYVTQVFQIPGDVAGIFRSDESGKITQPVVPKNGVAIYAIEFPGGLKTELTASTGTKRIRLNTSSSAKGKLSCDQPDFDWSGVWAQALFTDSREEFKGYHINYAPRAMVLSDGSYSFAQLIPGNYKLAVRDLDKKFYVRANLNLVVGHDEAKTIDPVEYKTGIPISGRVINAETKSGVPNAKVSLGVRWPGTSSGYWNDTVSTNDEGFYKAIVPPALVGISFNPYPKNYLRFSDAEFQKFRRFDTSTGKNSYVVPDIPLRPASSIKGVVVDENGKAIVGATIWPSFSNGPGNFRMVKSGQGGKFEIEGIDPNRPLQLKAKYNDLLTDGIQGFDPTSQDPIRVEVSHKHAFRFKFNVVDESNQPITNAMITNSYHSGNTGSTSPATPMNRSGEYESGAMFAEDRYQFEISALGYSTYMSKLIKGVAGEERDLGKIVLRSKSFAIKGVVVDSLGQPVEGAAVFSGNVTPSDSESKTNGSGEFELNDLLPGPAAVFVSKPGFQFAGAFLELPTNEVRIELRRVEEAALPSESARPLVSFQRKQLAKYMLDRLFELPVAKRAQVNFLLLRYLAQIDPDAANELLKTPANRNRTADVKITGALELLHRDSNNSKAVEVINQFATSRYFYLIVEAAERVSIQNPNVARKLTRIVQARLVTESAERRLAPMVRIGALMIENGEPAAGKKLIEEAFVLAEGLGREGTMAFYVAAACERLGKFDLARANKILDTLNFGEGSSKVRHLGNMAVAIANQDPARAIEMLDQAGPYRAADLVYKLGKDHQESAIKVIDSLAKNGQFRQVAQSKIALALVVHRDDPEFAHQLIRDCFKIFQRRDTAFDSMMNYGYEAPAAGFTALIGKQIGYPDVQELVMRALASRRQPDGFTSDIYALKATLKQSKFVALSDRNASRFLLRSLKPNLELLGGGGYDSLNSEDWLLGWSLTDTTRAKEIFDEMLKEDQKQGVLRQGRLTRVIGLLLLPDDQFWRKLAQEEAVWYPGQRH